MEVELARTRVEKRPLPKIRTMDIARQQRKRVSKEHLETRSGERIAYSRFQAQLEEDGGGSTVQLVED